MQLLGKFEEVFVHIAQNRYDKPAFGVDGDTDMVIILVDNRVIGFVNTGIGAGMFFRPFAMTLRRKAVNVNRDPFFQRSRCISYGPLGDP